MKKQNKSNWQTIAFAAIVIFIVFGASGAVFAQKKGAGAKYGTRDPKECAKTAAKTKVPTVAEAVASVICNGEIELSGSLFLFEEVKVMQIGKGTPFKRGIDVYATDIDLNFLIYPIRGSLKYYQCSKPSDLKVPERSCRLYEYANATGRCYKNGFGNWICGMTDMSVSEYTKVVPPGGKTAAKDAPVKDKPDTTDKPEANTGEKKTDKPAETGEIGFAKPDFSEMEKYFEIIRYEYDFTKSTMYILVKIKKPVGVNGWLFNYYDADGVKLDCYGCSSVRQSGDDRTIGEVVKMYVGTPSEKLMKEVKKITITKDF